MTNVGGGAGYDGFPAHRRAIADEYVWGYRTFREVGVGLWGGRRRGDGRGGGFRLALDMAGGFPGGEDFVVAFVDLAEDGVEGFDGALAGAEGGGDGGGS